MQDTPQETPSLLRRSFVGADGFYRGIIKLAADIVKPVGWINSGLRKVGLPMPDQAVGGSEWAREKLTGLYNDYNRIIGHAPPAPADKTDKIVHAVADFVGQSAIPLAGSVVTKPAAVIAGRTGAVEGAQRVNDVREHAERIVSTTGEVAKTVSERPASVAGSLGAGMQANVSMGSAFTVTTTATAVPSTTTAAVDRSASPQGNHPVNRIDL